MGAGQAARGVQRAFGEQLRAIWTRGNENTPCRFRVVEYL